MNSRTKVPGCLFVITGFLHAFSVTVMIPIQKVEQMKKINAKSWFYVKKS